MSEISILAANDARFCSRPPDAIPVNDVGAWILYEVCNLLGPWMERRLEAGLATGNMHSTSVADPHRPHNKSLGFAGEEAISRRRATSSSK